MKLEILFPDSLHFHERNFKSLIEVISKNNNIKSYYIKEYNNLKALYGNYIDCKSLIIKYYDDIKTKNKDELLNLRYNGINIFYTIKAEILSYLMSLENWYNNDISSDESELFNKMYNENLEELLLNYAFSLFWIDFWQMIIKNHKSITHCLVFSGSLIYVKTLVQLLKNTKIKVFVLETFMTGNDYYFEEKYDHIANNSDIKFDNIYNSIILSDDFIEYEKDKIKAINKFILRKNKNVVQPNESKVIKFYNGKPVISIIGQVINDFSILETRLENINSLSIYKKTIIKIINETEYNIIFKAHPWENKKINIKSSLTLIELSKFINKELSEDDKKRIFITEDYKLELLVENSDIIFGICSQALIEASYYGKKTVQIGKAFFGNKGFTNDCDGVNDFIKQLKSGKLNNSKLNMEEYNMFYIFLIKILEKHLVSIYKSGESKLLSRLMNTNQLSIKIVNQKENSKLDENQFHSTMNKEKNNSKIKNINKSESEFEDFVNLNQKFIAMLIKKLGNEKKYNRFRRSPKVYFERSTNKYIRLIGRFW